MSGVRGAAQRTAAEQLYRSLIASRNVARQRLEIIHEIERQHRHTPLVDLVELAAAGALRPLGHPQDDGPPR